MPGLAPTESTENLSANNNMILKIASLNVCGIRSKLPFPEFASTIRQYDIIGLQETKTDDLDDISFENYNLHFLNRNHMSKRKPGGIALMYKRSMTEYIKLLDSDSKLVLWFSISKRLTKTNDILCGIVYIPPESSEYASECPFDEIENEMYHTVR